MITKTLTPALAALVVLALVVIIGHRLTTDWVTVWLALTALAATLSLAAATMAALYAKEQIDSGRTLGQINLTISLLFTYTPRIVAMNERIQGLGTWTQAREITNQAIQMGDNETIDAQQQVITIVSEFADLYACSALHPDLLFRRTDYSICLAWFMFQDTFYSWGALQVVRLDAIRQLATDAYSALRKNRPQLVQSIPELRSLTI